MKWQELYNDLKLCNDNEKSELPDIDDYLSEIDTVQKKCLSELPTKEVDILFSNELSYFWSTLLDVLCSKDRSFCPSKTTITKMITKFLWEQQALCSTFSLYPDKELTAFECGYLSVVFEKLKNQIIMVTNIERAKRCTKIIQQDIKIEFRNFDDIPHSIPKDSVLLQNPNFFLWCSPDFALADCKAESVANIYDMCSFCRSPETRCHVLSHLLCMKDNIEKVIMEVCSPEPFFQGYITAVYDIISNCLEFWYEDMHNNAQS